MTNRAWVVAVVTVLASGAAVTAESGQGVEQRLTAVEQQLSQLQGQVAALQSALAGLTTPFYASVDCAAGQTIGAALQRAATAPSVLLSVSGTCHEPVRITRDNVGIMGQPGAGIQVDAGQEAALAVSRARGVWVTGLSLQGGYGEALSVDHAEFRGERVLVSGANEGVRAQGYSRVSLSECTIEGNSFEGVLVGNSEVGLFNCSVRNNGTYGVWVQSGHVSLPNVEIANNPTGLAADAGSVVVTSGQYLRITANQLGVRLKLHSLAWHVGAVPDVSGNTTDFEIDATSAW